MSSPPCSPTGSLRTEKLCLQSQRFILSFISVRVPNKEPSHEKRGKNLVTVHGAPRGRKAYIQWGVVWLPKRIVYDTAISTPVSCSLSTIPSTLAWVDQSPVSQRVVATLIRVWPPQLLPHPTYGRGVGFMGDIYPREEPQYPLEEGYKSQGQYGWVIAKIKSITPTGDRTPDRPARRDSLYS